MKIIHISDTWKWVITDDDVSLMYKDEFGWSYRAVYPRTK